MARDLFQELPQRAAELNDRLDGAFFRSLCEGNVMYSHVSHLGEVTPQKAAGKDTLVVRDGDVPFDDALARRFRPMFSRIFCQNKSTRADGVYAIPIGMEAREWCSFDKFDVIREARGAYSAAPSPGLYGNFSVWTNQAARRACHGAFKGKPYFRDAVASQLTPAPQLTEQQYRKFCDDVLGCMFALAPVGNGIDTHRFWEILWLGRVPVTLHNPVVDSFPDLPVLVLDRWEDFERESERFLADDREYDYGCMTFAYWRRKILGEGK